MISFKGQPGECSETAHSWLPHVLPCKLIISWELLEGVKPHLCFNSLRLGVTPIRNGRNLLFSLNLTPKSCRGSLLIFSWKAVCDDSSLFTLYLNFFLKIFFAIRVVKKPHHNLKSPRSKQSILYVAHNKLLEVYS